jgi:hypothetical protein
VVLIHRCFLLHEALHSQCSRKEWFFVQERSLPARLLGKIRRLLPERKP